MSNFLFRLPDIGEGVTEAEITGWYVKPGDTIAEDQSLVDVMTDKATVDMTSPVAGVVLAIHGAVGDMVPVGSVLVEIETEAGEAVGPSVAATPVLSAPAPAAEPVAPIAVTPNAAEAPTNAAPLAAPATRRRAAELGIALEAVRGSGAHGIITAQDIERHAAQSAPSAGITEIKITGLRRKIAERMAEATRRIPHFSYVEEFDMTVLEDLRARLNGERGETRPKLTLLPFFMRALVKLRTEFPSVNARYDDEAGVLQQHDAVHIGIATQTAAGLMVPVVRHAETLDLWGLARELSRVTTAARDGSATREELSGSTITLTSLGALGGIAATPIINAPEVAIIGPNKLVQRPVVLEGQIVIRQMMNLSSSFDHRIIDGHEAARFVQGLKRLIEQPALLFIEMPKQETRHE
ncbi:dihydrolipoamide acetyltransferase family protein [Devosia sp. A449]